MPKRKHTRAVSSPALKDATITVEISDIDEIASLLVRIEKLHDILSDIGATASGAGAFRRTRDTAGWDFEFIESQARKGLAIIDGDPLTIPGEAADDEDEPAPLGV